MFGLVSICTHVTHRAVTTPPPFGYPSHRNNTYTVTWLLHGACEHQPPAAGTAVTDTPRLWDAGESTHLTHARCHAAPQKPRAALTASTHNDTVISSLCSEGWTKKAGLASAAGPMGCTRTHTHTHTQGSATTCTPANDPRQLVQHLVRADINQGAVRQQGGQPFSQVLREPK